jgi:23S rRNA (guanosine2251-2'-O)-methyltransferase
VIVFGINPVLEALRAGRVRALQVSARDDARMQHVVEMAGRAGVPVRRVDRAALDRASQGGVHQGVVAELAGAPGATVEQLVAGAHAAAVAPLIVVLDGVEDPHNLGAVLRSVDAAGGHGLVRQERRAAPLEAAAAKASAGAIAWVPVADVVNIARAIEELKALHVWTVGLAGDASQPYDAIDLTLPTAIVLGAEGRGLRRLVRERCDLVVSIPMHGHVESLNVSVAAAIVLFEARRQRRA